jgi:hypothetical protein
MSFIKGLFQKMNVSKTFANVHSAVRVFTGEAGVTFAKY